MKSSWLKVFEVHLLEQKRSRSKWTLSGFAGEIYICRYLFYNAENSRVNSKCKCAFRFAAMSPTVSPLTKEFLYRMPPILTVWSLPLIPTVASITSLFHVRIWYSYIDHGLIPIMTFNHPLCHLIYNMINNYYCYYNSQLDQQHVQGLQEVSFTTSSVHQCSILSTLILAKMFQSAVSQTRIF